MTEINGYTRTCGLIGNPVEHTFSPALHNTLAECLGDSLCYVPFHVEDGYLGDAVKGAYGLNLLGVNVTVPYKTDVIPYLQKIDPLAEQIGAVNTLVRTEGGFKGFNTDMPGLYRAMFSDDVRIKGEQVLILGAGGVARAVAVLLVTRGVEKIFLLNRTPEKAVRIAEEVNAMAGRKVAEAMALSDYAKLPAGERFLAVQATSVGMHPHEDEVLIGDEAFYQKIHTGYELIFNPAKTRFMQMVEAQGGRAFNGLKMLLYQGVIAYELWTGKTVPEAAAERAFAAMRKVMRLRGQNVMLIGFMGSGKTSVGVRLSYKLRVPVEDTDKMIEKRQGCTVREIFERDGEEAFRGMESQLLSEIAERGGRKIYSLGGGTPVHTENRELVKKCGTVVYLRAEADTIYERLKGDNTRPLLQCEDPRARIGELLAQRKEAYESCADVIVDVDGLTVDEIIERICQGINFGREEV